MFTSVNHSCNKNVSFFLACTSYLLQLRDLHLNHISKLNTSKNAVSYKIQNFISVL